jgi:hypothetical protein
MMTVVPMKSRAPKTVREDNLLDYLQGDGSDIVSNQLDELSTLLVGQLLVRLAELKNQDPEPAKLTA